MASPASLFDLSGRRFHPEIRAVPEGDKSDQEWRRKEASKYVEDSWPRDRSHSSCTIFQAPNYMKRYNDKAYKPTVVAIGPFYFDKGQEKPRRLYKYKIHCVSYLLERHGSDEKVAELLKKCMELVLTLEARARSCYSGNLEDFSRHDFAEMLLQDGCFILRLLLNQKKGKSQAVDDTDSTSQLKRRESEITAAPMVGRLWFWKQVVYDLLKLENQIPFFVIQSLFDILNTPDDEGINLVELALKLFSGIYPSRANTFKPPPSSDVFHLLHLFHSSLIPPKLENTTVTEGPDRDPSTMVADAPDWIPSATLLQDAGIKIQPPKRRTAESFLDVTCENEMMENKIRPKSRTAKRFLDVTFKYGVMKNKIRPPKRRTAEKVESFLDVTFENGVMEIPPLQVDDYTRVVFRNLIAFEQCYLKTTTHITNYARFMDDLINTTKDVRLLSLDGVLLNRLGSEETAANLLNKLCDYVPERNYLRKVITDITEYYERPWHKWFATLLNKYFSNPWAIISVLAAVVLLLLTIEQAVFAGLSYLRPPS